MTPEDPYREAEARIAAWRPGETLDLAIWGLERIPPAIAALTDLQSVNCTGTQVADLGPIAGLTGLQSLLCIATQVADLGPIAGLTGLQSLIFWDTQVADLGPIAGLTGLQSLACWGTHVADLGPIAGLTGLRSLNCSSTRVANLGPIAGLTGLQSLNCNGCRIARFPEGLFERESLQEVLLHKATLGEVPGEVLSQSGNDNCLPRLRAHFRDLGAGAVRVRDAKLLVLGNGRVGKTQLVRQLAGEGFDEAVASTHGVVVRPVDLDDPGDGEGEGAPARLWVWDFGGQDIYHATHTLFMRSRGIYLVAWTPGQEDSATHLHEGRPYRNRPLPWWLAQVVEFGGAAAPLIVVQTQADHVRDRRPLPPTAQAAYERFATRVHLDHSAVTPRGAEDLRAALAEAYATIPKPVIGRVRAAVQARLAGMIAGRTARTLTRDDFARLCDECGGVADAGLFLETLHHAGVVFHQAGYFDDDIILDQEWAIAAIYAVFDRANKVVAAIESNGGRFTRPLLGALVWDAQHSPAEQELFLAMMRSCGICFALQGGEAPVYVAPDLLPPARPAGWDGTGAAAVQTRRYRHLPDALVRNVIAAVGAEAGAEGQYWRHGLRVHETRRGSDALIEARIAPDGAGTLDIRTRDGAAASLLRWLADLVGREEGRLGLAPPQIAGADPAPADQTPARFGPARFGPAPRATPRDWFFSYAQESEAAAKDAPVAAFCARMAAERGITIRRDVAELRTGDAIDPFMRELGAGERIYVWLTDAYLKSPWCMTELTEIWRCCGREGAVFEQRVVFLLGDAQLRTEAEQKAYRDYWDSERDAAIERMKRAGAPQAVAPTCGRICEIIQVLCDLLPFVAARIRHRDFAALAAAELAMAGAAS